MMCPPLFHDTPIYGLVLIQFISQDKYFAEVVEPNHGHQNGLSNFLALISGTAYLYQNQTSTVNHDPKAVCLHTIINILPMSFAICPLCSFQNDDNGIKRGLALSLKPT